MSWLREYRTLLILYGLFGLLAVAEVLSSSDDAPANQPGTSPPDEATQLVEQLYPHRPEALFWRGMEAVEQNDLRTARRLFEQALSTGVNTHESLLYNYAIVLLMLHEAPAQIDTAVARWRRFFPHSTLPDPRQIEGLRAE